MFAIAKLSANQREKIDWVFADLLSERFRDANPTFAREASLDERDR